MTNNAALDGGRETVVQFDHLQHVYPGGVEALKDINLSFRKEIGRASCRERV